MAICTLMTFIKIDRCDAHFKSHTNTSNVGKCMGETFSMMPRSHEPKHVENTK